MIETPVRFIRGILGYKKDPDVRMDDFDEYLTVGETAPDFTLRTIQGEEWSLSDHCGEYIVLEFGSYTCPMYRRPIPRMAQLARKWASDEVTFVLVYQKEAHPNQGQFLDIDDPETYAKRRRLAERLHQEEDVPMTVLVDEVPRNVSATYGGGPNMLYVVGPDGKIVYKSLWMNASAVNAYFEQVL